MHIIVSIVFETKLNNSFRKMLSKYPEYGCCNIIILFSPWVYLWQMGHKGLC